MKRIFVLVALVAVSLFGEMRDGAVVSDGTATDSMGHRFTTVTVTLNDDSGQPWKTFVVSQLDFQGKYRLGPVGAHFQCDIGKSLIRAGELFALSIPVLDSKGRKKTTFFNIVETK
jgi:hypothetical protein